MCRMGIDQYVNFNMNLKSIARKTNNMRMAGEGDDEKWIAIWANWKANL